MDKPQKTGAIRDPERTRGLIIEAAVDLIAKEGSDAVSVSKVAQLAGVNRGTAYLHFKGREELVSDAVAYVREQLIDTISKASANMEDWTPDDNHVMEQLSLILSKNVRLASIWLTELVLRGKAEQDPLFKAWTDGLESMRATKWAADDIDYDVLAVLGLSATFIWPILNRADRMSAAQQKRLAKRFADGFRKISQDGILAKNED